MKKTGSTGDLFRNEQKYFMRNRLRPVTAMRHSKYLKSTNFFPQSLSSLDINSYTNNQSICNCEHLLSNKTPKQLFDSLMSLKKKVNFLNEEISFAKSERRKKDVQLITKNKEIEEFLSDIKTSRDLNPVNVDKLKEINAISKYKQEYNKLKNILDDLKSKVKTTEINIKNSRPYNAKQFNLGLENKLKTLISEYNILHKNNTDMNTQLEEMENLPVILSENHKIIEKLKEKIDIQEKNVADLKNKIMLINEKKNYNETILDRQKIKNINLNLKNHYLENAIENRKQIVELKAKYTNKIKKLKEKKDELEDKYKNQERLIKSIKREIKLYEDNKKAVHPLQLKTFNYKSISKVESNPLKKVGTKLMLFQSLLDESYNKKIKYKTSIKECIARFKLLGYDYTQLDKIIEEGKDIEKIEQNDKEKENKKSNEINENKKENNEINNNNDLDVEYNKIINDKEKEEEKQEEKEEKQEEKKEEKEEKEEKKENIKKRKKKAKSKIFQYFKEMNIIIN